MDKSTIKFIWIVAASVVGVLLFFSVWQENKREDKFYESISNGTNGIVKELKYKAQQSKYEERMQQLYHKGYTDGYKHGDQSENWKYWGWSEEEIKRTNESDAYTYWTWNCEDSELEDETLFQEYRRGWYAGIQKRKESGH
ncbi:MAG: hypothetical protein IJT90_06005 [Bacteroidaceae bacterium]|nr:hypothetical protein [Bacteroidaceae bacterium]